MGANLLRVLNPQRWNMYTYAVNNPLVYTDPTGLDAIIANFSTLAVGLGHAVTISVHSDGSATYMDYGPRGGGKPVWGGNYNVVALTTKLAFGSNGVPTASSAEALIEELAGIENVDPNTVGFAYYKTSPAETAALDQYIQGIRNFNKSWWKWASLYFVGMHDCESTMDMARSQAHIGTDTEGGEVPNSFFLNYLATIADAVYSGDKEAKKAEVTSKICYETDSGRVCQ